MKLKRMMAIVLCFAMVLSTMSFSVFAEDATVTVSSYDELVAALTNAETETIELAGDITIDTSITVPDGVILDLKGNTLYVNVENSYYNNVTIKNGNIVLGKDDVHVCDGYFLVNEDKALVLSDVNMSSATDGIKGYAVFHLKTGANLDLIDSTLNISDNEYAAGYIVYAGESTATVDITRTTVTGTNVNGIVYATTVIDNSTFTIGDANEHGINRSAVTINDSTVTISGGTGRGITAEHGDLVIRGDSVVNISDMGEATIELRGDKNLTVADTATVTVDVAVNNTTSGTITGDVTVDGATEPPVVNANVKIGDQGYNTLADALEATREMSGDVVIELLADANLSYGAREAYGKDDTTSITINGNNNTLTLNQTDSDWSSIGMANADGVFKMNNVNVVKTGYGVPGGAWNTHAINFNVNTELTNVDFDNSIKVSGTSVLTNVNIVEDEEFYGIWIPANATSVTINGGSIKATNNGRGIKIADQYVEDSAQKVSLTVDGMTFETVKKAAVLVSSKGGADINLSNVDISGVAADTVNAVWNDEDTADYLDKITVTGGTVKQEGATSVAYVAQIGETKYTDLKEALDACTNGETIMIIDDITYDANDIVYAHGGATGFGNYDQYNPSIIYVGGTKGATPAENQPSNVNAVIDLNGHTITNNADSYLFIIMDNAKVTFTDSLSGGGVVGNSENYPVIWSVGSETLVTIEKGNYITNSALGLLHSTHSGDLVIEGGEFSTTANDASLLIMLNSQKYNNPNYFLKGIATVAIKGGTFHGFNPEKVGDDYGASSIEEIKFVDGCADGFAPIDNGNGIYSVVDYVQWIKDELLAGRDVTLTRDVVVDGSYITSEPHAVNSNGKYPNYGIFTVVGDYDVTIDLNGYDVTYNGHANFEWNGKTYNSCTVAHGLFFANGGADLTIKDSAGTSDITVYGLASGAYVATPNTTLTIEGGTWKNEGCATCGGTNIFLYPLQGGELYITDGHFDQALDSEGESYLIVEHGGAYANSVIDYSKTKVEISGGTFVGMNPEKIKKFNQTADNKLDTTTEPTTNGCANGFEVVINDDGNFGVQVDSATSYVAKVGNKSYESFVKAVEEANAVAEGATIELLKDVTLGETLEITGNVTISGEYTITRADNYTGTLFAVSAEATLTLDGGLVVDGGNAWNYIKDPLEMDMANGNGTNVGNHITPAEGGVNATASLIKNNGKLNANKVTIENSYSTNGVSAIDCGKNSATILNGAVMQKIAANRSGAVVYVGGNDAVLTIKGDTKITGNFGIGNGGIIQNYGQGTTVNMEGGSIDNNHIGKSGTLYASYSGNANKINTFNMSGGIITKNIMEGYGPVYIHTNTVWNMTGGEISENTSFLPNYVRNNNPAGIMSGGKIVNNIITGTDYSNGYYVTHPDLRLNGKTGITGGEFTQDVTEYLAPNIGLVYNEATGIYSLTQELYEYNGVAYKTFSEVIEKIKSAPATLADEDKTPVVKVLASHKVDDAIVIDTNIVLDLNGKTITGAKNSVGVQVYPVIRVQNGANVTVKNGTITNADYVFVLGSSDKATAGNLTIESGKYHGQTTVASVTKGNLTILGGEFSVDPYEGNYNYLLNCIDENYKNGTAAIVVKGGTFANFNPANNAAEGENTKFVADGYKSFKNGDETYTVRSIKADAYTVTAEATATEVRYNNGNPDSFTVKYVVTGGNVAGATAQFKYDTDLFICEEDSNATGRIRMNSMTLTTDANGETLLKELHFTVKKNVDANTTYTFTPEYVQVVSDEDAAGSGAQDGYVENVKSEDVTVIAQYDVTLPTDNSLEGNTYVDQNADYSAIIKDFDENKTYTITYTMGGVEQPAVTVTKDNDVNDGFVIENVTGDIVFTGVTSELNYELILLPEAISGYTLILVKDGVSAGYTYNGDDMFAVERYVGLTSIVENTDREEFVTEDGVDILGATSVRAILIKGGVTLEEARNAIAVSANESDLLDISYDINRNGAFWFNDAATAHYCYKDRYTLYENMTKLNWYLSSDVNADFVIDTDDYDDTVEAFWANLD